MELYIEVVAGENDWNNKKFLIVYFTENTIANRQAAKSLFRCNLKNKCGMEWRKIHQIIRSIHTFFALPSQCFQFPHLVLWHHKAVSGRFQIQKQRFAKLLQKRHL